MGNCVSCTEPSSHEQPERWTDGDKKLTELEAPGEPIQMSGRSEMPNSGVQTNGSCTPGSTNSRLSPLEASAATGPPGIGGTTLSCSKQERKRKNPLGRSGSDKKSNVIGSPSIKDNNNAYSESRICTVFDTYKDPAEDCIGPEGIERLCRDLEVKPEDFRVLVLAWKFGAEQMCRFTREEFYRGMKELKTDNVKGIQARLPDCVNEVTSNPALFKDLYRFAFRFGLDTDVGQRSLPVDMACSLWRVVFSNREPPLLNRWINFLETHPHVRGIPRDTWNMFLNFVESVDDDLSSYDDTEAWPSLFDDFVEHEHDRVNQNLNLKMDQDEFTLSPTTPSSSELIPPPSNFKDS